MTHVQKVYAGIRISLGNKFTALVEIFSVPNVNQSFLTPVRLGRYASYYFVISNFRNDYKFFTFSFDYSKISVHTEHDTKRSNDIKLVNFYEYLYICFHMIKYHISFSIVIVLVCRIYIHTFARYMRDYIKFQMTL